MQSKKTKPNPNRAAFERAAARYILGESPGIELKGTSKQVQTASAVIKESRALLLSLRGDDLNRVRLQLERKRQAATRFFEVYGYAWPF